MVRLRKWLASPVGVVGDVLYEFALLADMVEMMVSGEAYE